MMALKFHRYQLPHAVLQLRSEASFPATVLQVRPDCMVALIKSNGVKDGDIKVIPCEHQLTQQRELVWPSNVPL